MNILVINCGSSSIKYRIFDVRNSSVLASGLIDMVNLFGHSESQTLLALAAVYLTTMFFTEILSNNAIAGDVEV